MQIKQVKLEILNCGFNFFEENLFQLDKKKIHSSFDKYYKNHHFRKNNYENIAIIDYSEISKTPFNKVLKKINQIFIENNLSCNFKSLWLQKSNKKFTNTNINDLPFIPHIDKKRYLKVMIYLDDVDINSGPINIACEQPSKFESLRKSLPIDYKEKKKNVIKTVPLKNFVSCSGKFGTTIFFDTNTPHFAGQVKKNFLSRKILRFNFVENKVKFKLFKIFYLMLKNYLIK